jgi:hypothetical protein
MTPWMHYIDDELVGIVYNAVVKLDGGDVDEIKWDNYCDMCDEDCLELDDEEVCAESLCDVDKEEDCDPRIYITFMGTDSDDKKLVSASLRLS